MKSKVEFMQLRATAFCTFLSACSFVPFLSYAQEADVENARAAFNAAILAAEHRDYDRLAIIVETHPEALEYRTDAGDDLFHEFRYVFHSDTGSPAIDLRAIETLLNNDAIPRVSNGLLTTLLSEANAFGSQIDALPIENGGCLENREEYFPVIDNLISAGAKFGKLEFEIEGIVPSEAFFYQYQMCFRPLICGGAYESPADLVQQRVSDAMTPAEKEVLLNLVPGGNQDLNCLIALNDW